MEISTISMAVLIEPLSSVPALGQEDVAGLFKRPYSLGQAPDGQFILSSGRDQAEIWFGVNKVDVRDLKGNITEAKSRIPWRLRNFLDLISNPPLLSLGLNFIVEVSAPDAPKVLATTFLKTDVVSKVGTETQCDTVSLKFQHHSNKAWTIRFNTRGDDIVIVNLNASEQASVLPDDDVLGKQLELQYAKLADYIKLLKLEPDD